MKTALSIAGSDCSGGAGIQADLKTMTMHGVYAMSAITALTAQNTTGVSGIVEVSPDFLRQQIDMIFCDIPPDAVKIGMVPSPQLVEVLADRLTFWKAAPVVVDPVMVASSGASLMKATTLGTLVNRLLPLATLATPNIPEAEALTGMTIHTKDQMIAAATAIHTQWGCAVLLKGGHSLHHADDLLLTDGAVQWLPGKRIHNPNTHGTGCTLSAAIVSNLAIGYDLSTSVRMAKDYISGALSAMLNLGKGSGPVNHAFMLRREMP